MDYLHLDTSGVEEIHTAQETHDQPTTEEVAVTIAVHVGPDRKQFTAATVVNGDGINVASSLTYGLRDDAGHWLSDLRTKRRATRPGR